MAVEAPQYEKSKAKRVCLIHIELKVSYLIMIIILRGIKAFLKNYKFAANPHKMKDLVKEKKNTTTLDMHAII